jgi:hypothetical protein
MNDQAIRATTLWFRAGSALGCRCGSAASSRRSAGDRNAPATEPDGLMGGVRDDASGE